MNLTNTQHSVNKVHELFHSYIGSLTRLRWFFLLTTSLSCLVLLHIYVERWGFQEAQLIGYVAKQDIRRQELATLGEQMEDISKKIQDREARTSDVEYTNLVKAYEEISARKATLEYFTMRTKNTLRDVKMQDRQLPILSFLVPANDYLTVLAMMNTIFVIGVWLILRSISAAVREIERSREMGNMATLLRINFTFTGLAEDGRGKLMAHIVQYSAFLLPAVSLLIAGYFDIESGYDMLTGKEPGFAGDRRTMIARTILIAGLLFITVLATQANIIRARRIETKIIGKKEE